MVAMFFTVSVVNNYALNLNIAMPLHMIFRSVSSALPPFPSSCDIPPISSASAGACILPHSLSLRAPKPSADTKLHQLNCGLSIKMHLQ